MDSEENPWELTQHSDEATGAGKPTRVRVQIPKKEKEIESDSLVIRKPLAYLIC